MEGAAETLGRLVGRMHRRALCVLLGTIVGSSGVPAQSTSFLVVEHPEKLVLYNRYQQVPGAKDLGGLLPFTPMKVVNGRDVLGDGITPCMSVEILDDPYYLLLDAAGSLVGGSHAGMLKKYPGARSLSDTILVIRGGSLRFEPPGSTPPSFLGAGDQLKRIFQFEGKTFVLRLQSTGAYGWLDLNARDEDRLWKIVKAAPVAGPVLSARIRDSVASKAARVNSMFTGLFSVFNRTAQRRLPVPRWIVENTDSEITCVLETTVPPDSFQESTRYFAKDLESMVLGSGLGVFASSGKIVIRPK